MREDVCDDGVSLFLKGIVMVSTTLVQALLYTCSTRARLLITAWAVQFSFLITLFVWRPQNTVWIGCMVSAVGGVSLSILETQLTGNIINNLFSNCSRNG